MNPTIPRIAELTAPADWRVVDFISDLHLQAGEPQTVQAWEHYMARTRADAVFILGDLFDVWVGDDMLAGSEDDGEEAPVAAVMNSWRRPSLSTSPPGSSESTGAC